MICPECGNSMTVKHSHWIDPMCKCKASCKFGLRWFRNSEINEEFDKLEVRLQFESECE